ncbi:unnamed protein product, partial [Symbiodinium microadriaticum]
VGQIARGTVRFCAQMGGQPPARHVLNRMAAMGTSGKHESNCERDLQNIMKDLRVKCKIETMKVTVNVPQRGTAEEYELPVIFPDTLAAALWDCGEDIFRHFMFGTTNARKYWKHCTERCSWFQGHPSSSYARKSCMVPLSLYGDEVQSFKNTEAGIVEILAWSSDFTAGHVPLERYMPILCSVLIYLAEAGHFGDFPPQGQYDVNLDSILRRAFGKFCAYKKSHKLDCSQPRFTPARCNRRNRASWACLNSKAIASKIISFWLTDEVSSWAMRPAATELDKRVATVMYTYVELFKLMDGCGAIFGEAEAQEFYEKGLLHLQIYSQLRLQSSRTFGASSPMRYLFHLLPKHHYMMHMVYDVRETLINP